MADDIRRLMGDLRRISSGFSFTSTRVGATGCAVRKAAEADRTATDAALAALQHLQDEVTFWRQDAAARLQTALTMARAYEREGKADLAAIYTVAIILPTRAALASAVAGEIYYPLCEGCSKPIEAGDVVFAIGDGEGQTGEIHAFCDRPKLDGHGGEGEALPEDAYLFVPDDSFSPDKIAATLAEANAYLGDRG